MKCSWPGSQSLVFAFADALKHGESSFLGVGVRNWLSDTGCVEWRDDFSDWFLAGWTFGQWSRVGRPAKGEAPSAHHAIPLA